MHRQEVEFKVVQVGAELTHVKDVHKTVYAQLFFIAITQSFLKVVPELVSETIYKQMQDYAKALLNSTSSKNDESQRLLDYFESALRLFIQEAHEKLTFYYSKYIQEIEKTFAGLLLEKISYVNRFLSRMPSSLDEEKKAEIMFSRDLLRKNEFLSLINEISQELKLELLKEYPYPLFFDVYLKKEIKIKQNEVSLLGNQFLNDQIKFHSYILTEKILSIVQQEYKGELPNFLKKSQQKSEEILPILANKLHMSAVLALKKDIQAVVKRGEITKYEGQAVFSNRLGITSPFRDFPMQKIDKKIFIKLSKNLNNELNQALESSLHILNLSLEKLYKKTDNQDPHSSNLIDIIRMLNETSYSKRLEFKLFNNGLCKPKDLIDRPKCFLNRFFSCFTHPKEVINSHQLQRPT